jgi:glycerophosphoryl diester phosphodiesterase
VTGLGAIALHCSARGLTAGIAAAVRADGFPLACYTINRRDEAERLFAMGVSAVFSDRPDLWAPAEM